MSTRIKGIVGPYRKSPGLILEELLAIRAVCEKCNTQNKIDWNEDLEHPRQPIVADDGRIWVPVSFPVSCVCGEIIDYQIKEKPRQGGRTFYGDEAHRLIKTTEGEISFFCITLVGIHPDLREGFEAAVSALKQTLKPDQDPKEWTYHATDIWSTHPDQRKYNLISVPEKISHMKSFAKLIRDAKPQITTMNFSSAIILPDEKAERKEMLNFQRDDILKQATLTSLEILRNNSMGINWIYDNIKDTTTGERTEGWADECFLGLQHNRQFVYLTAYANIAKPNFVRPGSHYLLEVADFISYWVAREFFRSISKQPIEIKCALMGAGIYQWVDINGNAEYTTCNGSDAIKRYFRQK